jgi:hypothetical protein
LRPGGQKHLPAKSDDLHLTLGMDGSGAHRYFNLKAMGNL